VTRLATRYYSKELGELAVLNKDGVTTFDFGEWKSTVASRKNDDGTISFITIDPTNEGFEFVVGERSGKRVLLPANRQLFRARSPVLGSSSVLTRNPPRVDASAEITSYG
jgi:hypothetical protein